MKQKIHRICKSGRDSYVLSVMYMKETILKKLLVGHNLQQIYSNQNTGKFCFVSK